MNRDTQGQGAVFVSSHILEDQTGLTLEDLCRACGAPTAWVLELVEEGVIAPAGATTVEWRFTGLHLRHARVAVRLQRDLGVNPAGAALALQLMEELDTLRAQLQALRVGR
jgi:chaperone modulatory protein CbpM